MPNRPTTPWRLTTDETVGALSSTHTGLTEAEAKARLARYGENIFREESLRSPITIFFAQFKNPLIIVLFIATLLTVALGKWLDAFIILFAILVNAALGFVQEFKAERAIADLRSYILDRTRVRRDGRELEIDARLIVPGDVIHLTPGSRVTADARLLSTTDLAIDEAILTGESLPEAKHTDPLPETTLLGDRANMAFAGTLVVDGSGFAVVTATGYSTEIGKLAKLVTETTTEKTPLQRAVERLTNIIVIGISILVAIIFVVGLWRGQELYEMLMLSIAIIVGAVPEALPIGITAVLAIGVQAIARRRGIMRSLTAAETLGSTTLIITDKTGTLTEGNMQLIGISTVDTLRAGTTTAASALGSAERDLLRLALCNTDVVIENPNDDPATWRMTGAILERNIVRAAALADIRTNSSEWEDVHLVIPFSSRHKFSVARIPASLLPGGLEQYEYPHVVLGAPDILLSRAWMDKDTYLQVEAALTAESTRGRRLLGVALVTPRPRTERITIDDIQNISFLGVLSFYDPIRADVPEALSRINSYGVKVIMATGDLPGTARAIAHDLGWEVDDQHILTGDQLHQLSDDELRAALPHIRVLARVTPEDKLRVTKLHQERGEIVAMTGDGVNDSPSLKAANIGIAVGSGSDVAKGIADLVLLNDSFNTIVATIEEGKRMLANIKKIFVYLMSNALDEVILIGGSVLMGVAMPVSAVQIIWVNLFTGSIPAISYAFDRQPIPKSDRSREFFDSTVKLLTIGIGIVTSVLLFVLYLILLWLDVPLTTARSVVFACFAWYILIIAFSFRNLELPIWKYSLTENKVLIFGTVLGSLLILATLYLPSFQNAFAIEGLSLGWFVFVALWLLTHIALVEGAKWLARTFFARTT